MIFGHSRERAFASNPESSVYEEKLIALVEDEDLYELIFENGQMSSSAVGGVGDLAWRNLSPCPIEIGQSPHT